MDAEAGGAADLQTDVMRFMAILALCLVAIFALVQSIPLAPKIPQPDLPAPPAATEIVPTPAVEVPQPKPQRVASEPRPQLDRPTDFSHRPQPESIPAPAPPPVARTEAAPVPAPPEPALSVPDSPPQDGFTLRFESDGALNRLVARGDVALYAIGSDRALRMNIAGGDIAFWDASPPSQYHEMDETTVPDKAITALRRSGAPGVFSWGVTLPPAMATRLRQLLSEQSGGALIISAAGKLRLEQ